MSNCGVGSGGFGLPGDVVAQHGVEGSVRQRYMRATCRLRARMAMNLQTFGSED